MCDATNALVTTRRRSLPSTPPIEIPAYIPTGFDIPSSTSPTAKPPALPTHIGVGRGSLQVAQSQMPPVSIFTVHPSMIVWVGSGFLGGCPGRHVTVGVGQTMSQRMGLAVVIVVTDLQSPGRVVYAATLCGQLVRVGAGGSGTSGEE